MTAPPTDTDIAPFIRREMPSGLTVFYRDSDHSYWTEIKESRGKWTGVKTARMLAVSTILSTLAKDQLLDWAANLAREGEDWRDVRGQAATRGTSAHDLILRTLLEERTSLSDLPEEYRPWGQAAFRWLRYAKPKVEAAEQIVASAEGRFAGRFDLFAAIRRRSYRVDFKTVTKWAYRNGKRLPPYPENAIQLDLYEQAATESGLDASGRGLIVRLGPDGWFDETPIEVDVTRGLRVLAANRARAEAVAELAYRFTPTEEAA